MRFTEQRLRSARRWIAWVCFEAVKTCHTARALCPTCVPPAGWSFR